MKDADIVKVKEVFEDAFGYFGGLWVHFFYYRIGSYVFYNYVTNSHRNTCEWSGMKIVRRRGKGCGILPNNPLGLILVPGATMWEDFIAATCKEVQDYRGTTFVTFVPGNYEPWTGYRTT